MGVGIVTTAGVVVVVTGRVEGTKIELVGGGCVVLVVSATVVVGSGGGVVGSGTVVPVERGAVVLTTGARVVGVVVPEPDAGAVVGDVSTLVDVDDVGPFEVDVVAATPDVVVRRPVVVVDAGDRVATCRRGELSLPVVTSNSRATSASDARTYNAALNR